MVYRILSWKWTWSNHGGSCHPTSLTVVEKCYLWCLMVDKCVLKEPASLDKLEKIFALIAVLQINKKVTKCPLGWPYMWEISMKCTLECPSSGDYVMYGCNAYYIPCEWGNLVRCSALLFTLYAIKNRNDLPCKGHLCEMWENMPIRVPLYKSMPQQAFVSFPTACRKYLLYFYLGPEDLAACL